MISLSWLTASSNRKAVLTRLSRGMANPISCKWSCTATRFGMRSVKKSCLRCLSVTWLIYPTMKTKLWRSIWLIILKMRSHTRYWSKTAMTISKWKSSSCSKWWPLWFRKKGSKTSRYIGLHWNMCSAKSFTTLWHKNDWFRILSDTQFSFLHLLKMDFFLILVT